MNKRSFSRAASLLLAVAAGAVHAAPAGEWRFKVLLDGKPIGTHRFSFDGQRQRDEAVFDVKVLGFTAYRYRHEGTERWDGDCLASLDARTDDDGKPSVVKAAMQGGKLVVTGGPKGDEAVDGCLMSYAYWHPAMRKASRLLNAQTGEIEDVKITDQGEETLTVRGQPVAAHRWRVGRRDEPVDLWYSPQGEWLGLQSMVSGRTLRYLLE